MSYESTAEPIKIGYLMDFRLSEDFPQHYRDDLTIPFESVPAASGAPATWWRDSRVSVPSDRCVGRGAQRGIAGCALILR